MTDPEAPKETSDYTSANRAAWDASAPAHKSSEMWSTLLADAAKPGFSELDDTLTGVLGGLDLRGKRAAQIGCNNARELLSLASLGIEPALGIDQSPAFLAQAAELAQAAGLSPQLLEADIYDLPESLGRYDLILITIGVLNWMPDLARFFQVVEGLMTDGGHLVIYETHPMLEMFDPDAENPHVLTYSYFDRGPEPVPEMIVYDNSPAGESGATGFWFIHTMGEIVTNCCAAGFTLLNLTEYPHSNREPAYVKYEGREAQVPMCFSLVARR